MISGVILLLVMMPLSYFMTKEFDIIGAGIANLISITIYNSIRIIFLWKKFRLFPFTMQSLYTVLLAAACYGICHFSFINIHGLAGMFLRSITFILLFATAGVYMKLSPDIEPVMMTIKRRLGIKKD